MSPSDIENQARNLYNASSDTFYSSAEILYYIYFGEMEIFRDIIQIDEGLHSSTTSVASQEAYTFPTGVDGIKRVTYDGRKLVPIDFREKDALTLGTATTVTGTPQYYSIWNRTLYLTPIPDTTAKTIAIYSYDEPTVPTASSTLDVPTLFHPALVNYVVSCMTAKDKEFVMAKYYRDLWKEDKMRSKIAWRKLKRGDAFATVKDEESLPTTILGTI